MSRMNIREQARKPSSIGKADISLERAMPVLRVKTQSLAQGHPLFALPKLAGAPP